MARAATGPRRARYRSWPRRTHRHWYPNTRPDAASELGKRCKRRLWPSSGSYHKFGPGTMSCRTLPPSFAARIMG